MLERPRDKWPGPRSNDKQTVKEMLNDLECHHWSECRQFFERSLRLSDLPVDTHEDVVQNAILTVMNYLPTFRFDCKFSTWLIFIARSRIADAKRELARARHILIPVDLHPPEGDDGNETNQLVLQDSFLPEDICIARETVDEVVRAMHVYINKHANRERNMWILHLHFFEQYSVAEIAKELHMKEPTVRAVINAFKRFLERSDEQGPPPDSIE